MSNVTDPVPRSTPGSGATASRSHTGWKTAAAEALAPVVLILAAVLAGSAAPWRDWVGRDIRIYATIAHFWREGLLPYRDLYDFKPPVIYLALRGSFALSGYDPEGLRRLLIALVAGAALIMYGGLRRGGARIAGPLAAFAFLTLMLADPARIVSQNTEPFAAGFVAAAFGCIAAGADGSRWWAVAGGVAYGLATMSKQPAVAFGLPLVSQLFVLGNPPRPWRDRLVAVLCLAAGALATVGSFVLYFAIHGALRDFYQAVFVDAAAYSGLTNRGWTDIFSGATAPLLFEMLSQRRLWPFSTTLVLLLPLTLLRPSRRLGLTWLWLATSYVVAVVGPRREYHYLIMSFPGLAIAVGTVGESLFMWRRVPWPPGSGARILIGTALAILCFHRPWLKDVIPELGTDPRITPIEEEVRRLGRRIAEAAEPGDTLLVCDEPHDLYLYADIPPASRNFYGLTPNPEVTALWKTTLDRKPTFITISLGTEAIMWQQKDTTEARLAAFLAREYQVAIADSPIGVVYRRTRDSSLPLPAWVFAPPRDFADQPADDANVCPVLEAPPPPSASPTVGVHWQGTRMSLSDMKPLATKFDFAPPRNDRTWNGAPLTMRGVKYDRGLGMHAWTSVTYSVPEDALWFFAVVGLADHAQGCSGGHVRFEVRNEYGHLLYDSGRVDPRTTPFPVTVFVHGVRDLTLIVSPEDDGRDCDHANWATAEFLLPPQ